MNAPLQDYTASIDNVRSLRAALECCDGITQPIRTALARCAQDFENGFRCAEACLAIATARIVCSPAKPIRRYANTYRTDLATMKDYNPELDATYSDLAIQAMTAIQGLLGTSSFDADLRAQYQDAIDEERTRAERLVFLAIA